ncbi:MAG: hypothetical protein ACNS61_07470 [Candidatus Wenzhouxiangella sp. M2_3B_020]
MMESKGKMAAYLVAMTVLGIVVFIGLAWLVEWREGQRVHVPEEVEVPAQRELESPLATLVAGARVSTETAQVELQRGRRSPAVHALDAAVRAVDVAHHAAPEPAKKTIEEAARRLQEARERIQNGDPEQSRELLGQAAERLRAARAALGTTASTPPPVGQLQQYDGALLLNAHGVRIGEVEAVAQEGDQATATIVLGGWRDWLGLFDAEGLRRRVPAGRLLYGKPQSVGMTKVALPTFQTALTPGGA